MDTGNRWGATSWGAMVASWSGVLFAVLAAVGFLILGQPAADATGDEIVQFFADNESATKWQALFFGVAAYFYLWFVGTIAGAVRRAEGDPAGRVPAVIVATGAASAGVYLAGEASLLTLGQMEGAGGEVLFQLASASFALTSFVVAAFIWAVTLGIIRTGLLADWLAWTGAAGSVLLLVNGVVQLFAELDSSFGQVLGSISFFVFLAWVGAVSLFYAWAPRARPMA